MSAVSGWILGRVERGWRVGLRVVAVGSLLGLGWVGGVPAKAASTGTASLFMPQATGAESQDGDYVSSSVASTGCTGPCSVTPLDTIYRYYIEVPSGLTRLRIQIFDADFGAGGTGEATAQRDRTRNAAFNSSVKYTLINPAGTTVATQTCAHTTTAFCVDNAWSSILDTTTTPIANGHWELDVDQSTAVDTTADSDINAFGIQADDGSQTDATELPVYYQAQNQIGQNPPTTGSGTKTYQFYPYITSGCTFEENDFDYDLDNGNANQAVGTIDFTSRLGSFTKNIANTGLSENDVWNTNNVTGYTSDTDSVDYGIWSMKATIGNYTNDAGINGNYANIYLATNGTATPPANNSPTPNTYRVYVPTDAGGAPVKPYMEQEVRYVFLGGAGGPNPPVVGTATTFQVTVQVVNPTAHAITFSGTDLVTVNVPGGGAVYGGSAGVTQGTITAQPATGGTGNITWNPATVAAGTTALLNYLVKVTPTTTGQRITVVGTVASGNGTRGTWVDETGNTAQLRATLTFGPLCELAATQGVLSAAEVADLRAVAADHGGVLVSWQTASEMASAGFDLYRREEATGTWHKVNRSLVGAVAGAPQGGNYRVLDESAPPSGVVHYLVVETEINGGQRHYPFAVAIEPPGTAPASLAASDPSTSTSDRQARRDPAWAGRLAAAATEAGAAALPAQATTQAALAPATGAAATAASPIRLKISVTQNGLYRIAPAMLAPLYGSAGLPANLGSKQGKYTLTNQGQPVAWTQDTDGSVLFYGQAIQSIYTVNNVYWLVRGNGATMGSVTTAAPIGTGSSTESFSNTVSTRVASFAATAVPADPESDYWYWDDLIAGDPVDGSKSYTVAAPNVNAGGGQQLTVHLAGATASPQEVAVSLNGVALGTTSWSGTTAQTATFAASGLNANGSNTVTLSAQLGQGASSSIVYLQSFDVAYERAFAATGDMLAFNGSGNSLVTVGGFSGPAIHLLDLTNPAQPAVVSGAKVTATQSGAQLTLVPSSATTPYLAVGPTGVMVPASVQAGVSTGLAEQSGGADYLILTTTDLAQGAAALAALRAQQGLRTAIVNVGAVMDEFNAGLYNPHAIQSFLAYVRARWNPVPRYVVFAGDGSFDYRNFLNLGGELVPPLMVETDEGLFASDNHMVDVDGDGIPDFAVGRLPVLSNSELQAYVSKLAAFEAAPSGSWIDQALMLADSPGPDDGVTNYVADSTAIAGGLPAGYAPQQIAVTPDTVAGARSALFSGLASGAGLVNYFGHAGLDRLSPLGLLTSADAVTLTNGPRVPMMAALTCNVNRFDVPGYSPLGALLANQPGGGVVGIWSSSGVSLHPQGVELSRLFYLQLAQPASLRLGDVMRQALIQYANEPGLLDTVNLYTLLGDPAIGVKSLVPPAGTSTSSNHRE